jgi:siderophore synthetase component
VNSDIHSGAAAVAHLQPSAWNEANRLLLVKAITEFSHELILDPRCEGAPEGGVQQYCLESDQKDVVYRFRARRLSLDHLQIDRRSLVRCVNGLHRELDAMSFVVEFAERLQLGPATLPSYLEELASTLSSAAFKLSRTGYSAHELVRADFQTLEVAMAEGHPCFVANNARSGFNTADYRAYAPEAAGLVTLVWLAARREHCDFGCVDDLSYDELIHGELSREQRDAFAEQLTARGLHPESYFYVPVHPWQWANRVAQLFAADLAKDDLVYLGRGKAHYRPQQSIRTLFNASAPESHYVKTALSIVNMGFPRGMSASLASSAAAVNEWVSRLVKSDPFLTECGFEVLREVAFIGYRHRHYERAINKRVDPYKEMLAALWRESPVARLRPRERLMTMAALFHVDAQGRSLLIELVRASRVGLDAWLRSYLTAYLHPQLHCFYAHRLVFTPHSENSILVLEDDIVTRTIIKDIAEDTGVLNPTSELAPAIKRLTLRVPEDVMTLSIFTDIFDCLFRFLAALLSEHAGYPEQKFWALVADCVHDYEQLHPELSDEFRRYDLFAPTFLRNCLNRLQLTNNQFMVDLNAPDPVVSLQFRGSLQNPIAPFARKRALSAQRDVHGTS